MVRKWVSIAAVFILALSLAGCATGRKQKDLEIQGLKNQISLLEAQIQSKEEELAGLKESLARAQEEKTAMPVYEKKVSKKRHSAAEVKSRPNVKQIQIALRNAGLNPGAIDGRMGRATRQAIREFQRKNNLPVDGKCGGKTWELLRPYLDQKIK
jgi:peptidoglycan hydrolase-like protein with peptidoglycan-binding domain